MTHLDDLAQAISPASPNIRAFAVEAARQIDALTPPAPTPPPSSSWPHGGVGIWRTGDRIPVSAAKFDLAVIANWQDSAAATLPAAEKVCLYTSCISCDKRADHFYGMSAQDLIAGGWYLKDAAGNPITSKGYPNSILADPAAPGYAQKWASNVAAHLRQYGYKGLQVDDVNPTVGVRAPVPCRDYPESDPGKWVAALHSFFANAATYLRSKGYYLFPNIWRDAPLSFMTGFAGLADAVMVEQWAGLTATLSGLLAANLAPLPLVNSNPDALRKTMLTVDTQRRGVFLYEPADGSDPWGTWATL